MSTPAPPDLPAWSEDYLPDRIARVPVLRPAQPWTRESAWGDGRGDGVRVAIVDSGVDGDHPRVGNLTGGVAIETDPDRPGAVLRSEGPHGDLYGHGTACAAIVTSLAPGCELYSVRVLNENLKGRGSVFAAGLEWALEHRMDVVNLSLSSRSAALKETFHELVDAAAYAGVVLVAAINNIPAPSYPSEFAGVLSVAAAPGCAPDHWLCNPSPPTEFGAAGIDLEVAWAGGGTIVASGNSFAAPHIAGMAARIRGAHPGASVAEVRSVLRALADNAAG